MTPATTTHPTERRARPRPGHVCTSNQCHQGRAPCPTRQACELPDEDPPSALEITYLVALFVGFAVVIVAALYASGGA